MNKFFVVIMLSLPTLSFAATVNLSQGESVTLSPNTTTTVTCGLDGGSSSNKCYCSENSSSSRTEYRIVHRTNGIITEYDYGNISSCNQSIIHDYLELCRN